MKLLAYKNETWANHEGKGLHQPQSADYSNMY